MYADYLSPFEPYDYGQSVISMSPGHPDKDSSLLSDAFSMASLLPHGTLSLPFYSNLSSFDSVSATYSYLHDFGRDVDTGSNTAHSSLETNVQSIYVQTSLSSSTTISDEDYAAIYESFIQSPEPSSSHDKRLTRLDYSQPYLPMSASSSSRPKRLSNPPEFDRQVKYEVNEYLTSPFSLPFDTDYQDSKRAKGAGVKTHTFRHIEEMTSHANDSADADTLYYLPSLTHTGDAQPGPFTKLEVTMSAQYIPTIKPLEADLYLSPRDITRGIHDVKYSSLPAHVPCRQNLKRKVDDLTRQTGQRTSSLALQPQKKKTQTRKRRRLEQKEKVSPETIAYHVLHSKSYDFKCPLCHEVKISRKSATDFIRHIRSHGEASYKCERCGASLSRRDALKRHKRSNICDPL